MSFIILFVWPVLHFGTINWGHVAVWFSDFSGTQTSFSQQTSLPVADEGAAVTATKPKPQIGFAGHGVFVQKIVVSFLHVQVVHLSGIHLSPGRCPCAWREERNMWICLLCTFSRISVKSFPKHSLYRRKLCIQLHAGICCCARRALDRDSNSLPGALLSYKSMRVLQCSPNPVWLKWAAVVSTSFPSICMSRGSRTLCTRKERHYNMCGRKMFKDENENNLEKKELMKALTNPLCRILSYANRYKCHFVHIHAHMLQLFRKSLAAMDRHDINPADMLKYT